MSPQPPIGQFFINILDFTIINFLTILYRFPDHFDHLRGNFFPLQRLKGRKEIKK